MNITKEQVEVAVESGLELLGPNSEIAVPVELIDGVFFLKLLLSGIAAGRIALSPTVHQEPPTPTEES